MRGQRRLITFLACVPLLLTLLPATTEAQHRGGGHGGGGGGAGARPPAVSPAPPHGGGGGQAVARPAGGPYHGGPYRGGYYGGYHRPYYPYWGAGWGWGWGLYGFYGYPYFGGYWGSYWGSPYWGWGYPSPYGYGWYGGYYETSVRLQVTPRETEVYVDGYRAGIVDEFDGVFQRLRLPPGNHEIALYLDGYHVVRQTLHLQPGGDFKIRHTMVPLAPGEPPDLRPEPLVPPAQAGQPPQGSQPWAREPEPSQGPPPQPPVPSQGPPPSRSLSVENSVFGTLSIRVQPANADVFIDGERWRGPESNDRLVVQVAEGTHHVEIRKDGYTSFSTDVQVRRGDTETLNVSLQGRQ